MPSLILFLCAGSARTQITSANYTFVVASGFLCDTADSGSCPAVAKSANGDSYEMSGAGTFDPQNKSVQAAGTFNHKSTNGNVLETGVWTASELVSFDSYGIAPGALRQKVVALGPQSFGVKRLPKSAVPMPMGGLAVFRIRVLPMLGASKTAVLQVNCALGEVPRERSVEGIRLTLDGDGGAFSDELGGRVMFAASAIWPRIVALKGYIHVRRCEFEYRLTNLPFHNPVRERFPTTRRGPYCGLRLSVNPCTEGQLIRPH